MQVIQLHRISITNLICPGNEPVCKNDRTEAGRIEDRWPKNSRSSIRRFTKDIDQLDSSYNILKNQLSATPNRELLLEAMIQNLQLQLNVLNQQLNIIHQIKQSKKYSHEKNDQTI